MLEQDFRVRPVFKIYLGHVRAGLWGLTKTVYITIWNVTSDWKKKSILVLTSTLSDVKYYNLKNIFTNQYIFVVFKFSINYLIFYYFSGFFDWLIW